MLGAVQSFLPVETRPALRSSSSYGLPPLLGRGDEARRRSEKKSVLKWRSFECSIVELQRSTMHPVPVQ